MSTWVLVIFIHMGPSSKMDSNTFTNIPGFMTLENCQEAAVASRVLVSGTKKDIATVCLEQKF